MTLPTTQAFSRVASNPSDPGASAEITGISDASGYYAVEKDMGSGVVHNGNHLFYSAFLWKGSASSNGAIQVRLGKLNRTAFLLADSQIQVSLRFELSDSGAIANPSAVQVDSILGQEAKRFKASLHTSSDAASTAISFDPTKPIWIAWYADITDAENTFKFWINGCKLQTSVISAGDEITAGDSTLGAYGLNIPTGSGTARYTTSQWFASAATGDELGLADFYLNLIDENDNYKPKDLGDGTVNGVVPHYYIPCVNGIRYDEVSAGGYPEYFDNRQIDTATGSAQEGEWYGNYKTDKVWGEGSSNAVLCFFSVTPFTEAQTSVFVSAWVRGNFSGDLTFNESLWNLYMADGDLRSLISINFETMFDESGPGRILDGTTYHSIDNNVTGSDLGATWVHVLLYLTTATTGFYKRINGANTVMSKASQTNTVPQVTGWEVRYFRPSTNPTPYGAGLTHMYAHSTIEANPQIPWTDGSAMYDLFVGGDDKPLDPGIDGSKNLNGVQPDIFINPALRVGYNGALAPVGETSADTSKGLVLIYKATSKAESGTTTGDEIVIGGTT